MRVLIVGCGYVGTPLGARLVREGHTVHGLRRSKEGTRELERTGIIPIAADITCPEQFNLLSDDYDWVVNTVSSSRGGLEEYRQVYLEATRHLVRKFAKSKVCKYVYTGSTSVYGQIDGSTVSEEAPTEPPSPTSRILVEVENLLRSAADKEAFPAVILRVAGIYGPDRGHLFLRYLNGEARLQGNGDRIINMIHRDDVVGGIMQALKRGTPGQVYNIADDRPVTQREFFHWLSSQLNKPLPPVATEDENSRRKRGLTQKKVSNARAKQDLDWQLVYPTFQEGYAAEIERLRGLGIL